MGDAAHRCADLIARMTAPAEPPAWMDLHEIAAPAPGPRIYDQPEHRFSHYVDMLFDRVILEPCWFTAVDHSGPVGQKGDTREQRATKRMRWEQRLKAIGVKPSGLDWPAVMQFDPESYAVTAICWIELKRGDRTPTAGQVITIKELERRGQVCGVARSIRDCLRLLVAAGFRLHGNADNIACEIEARLEAADAAAPAALVKKAKARGNRVAARITRATRGITALPLPRGR